jgi:hypothetical protein
MRPAQGDLRKERERFLYSFVLRPGPASDFRWTLHIGTPPFFLSEKSWKLRHFGTTANQHRMKSKNVANFSQEPGRDYIYII